MSPDDLAGWADRTERTENGVTIVRRCLCPAPVLDQVGPALSAEQPRATVRPTVLAVPRLIRAEREMQPDWDIGEVVPALELNPDLVRRQSTDRVGQEIDRVGREAEVRQNVGVARRLRGHLANVKGVRAKAARNSDAELSNEHGRTKRTWDARAGRGAESKRESDGRSSNGDQGDNRHRPTTCAKL